MSLSTSVARREEFLAVLTETRDRCAEIFADTDRLILATRKTIAETRKLIAQANKLLD